MSVRSQTHVHCKSLSLNRLFYTVTTARDCPHHVFTISDLLHPPCSTTTRRRTRRGRRARKSPPQVHGGLQWFDLMHILSYNVFPASAGVRSGAFPAAVSTSYSKGGDFYEYRATFTYAGVFAPRLGFLDFRF